MQVVISKLFEKLELIEQKLIKIEDDILFLQQSANNMDTHISFIENVYDSIKYPFYYFINTFSSKNIEPQIKCIKEN